MIEVAAPKTDVEKDKAISAAVLDIEKEFGKGSIVKMGDNVGIAIPAIPTGIYPIDHQVTLVGGIPKGRIVEIYGPESGGKTTLCLTTVASAQCTGGRAAYIDVEHALDPTWMSLLGVNVNDLLVSQPDCGEEALRIGERLLESKAFDVIVIDSVAALTPRAELEGEIGDATVGAAARLMSQACRRYTSLASKTGCTVMFINQIREKIGVTYGSNETTPGGRALKFYASLRLDVRRVGYVKNGEEIIGNRVRIKAVKNKCAAPFRQAETDLLFGHGFDKMGAFVEAAIAAGVIEKSGSWYSFNGERLGQGKANAAAAIQNGGLYDKILTKLQETDEQN